MLWNGAGCSLTTGGLSGVMAQPFSVKPSSGIARVICFSLSNWISVSGPSLSLKSEYLELIA